MDIGHFQSQLQKLNSSLYVNKDAAVQSGGFKHSGVYFKLGGPVPLTVSSADRHQASIEQIKYLDALDAGQLDRFLCGTCIDFVPEYDIIDVERMRVIAPGWRSILLRLVQLKVCTLDQARKVFSCSSLGQNDFDRMNFFERIDFIKKHKGATNA